MVDKKNALIFKKVGGLGCRFADFVGCCCADFIGCWFCRLLFCTCLCAPEILEICSCTCVCAQQAFWERMWAKKSGRRRRRRIRAADPIWGSNGRAEEEEKRKRRRRNKTIKKDEPISLERGKEIERALRGPEWDKNIAMRVHTVLEDFMEFHAFFETPEECAFWQNFFMENPEVNELDPIIVAHRVSVSKWVFKKSPIRKTIKCCLLIQNRPPDVS